MREDGECRQWPRDQTLIKWEAYKKKLAFFLSIIFFGFVKFVRFVVS